MSNPNLPQTNPENSKQNISGNMYSYKNDNNIINNPNEFGTAIRRSIGSGNPNNDFPKINYEQNYINGGEIPIKQSQSNYIGQNHPFLNWVPYIIFGCVEILMIILIGCLFKWDIRNSQLYSLPPSSKYFDPKSENKQKKSEIEEMIADSSTKELNMNDGLFRDINIMVFAGFGMFHTLLKRYSWTSISLNMMAIAFSFQIGLFTNLLWKNAFKEKWQKGILNFESFIKSIINSCSILVSLGCILGKLSTTQYIILIIFETIMSSLNFQLCDVKLKAIDVGGTLYIHTFGAIFGIAVYMVLFCSSKRRAKIFDYNSFNKGNYFSNITSFIGVLFLFSYFPSFNSALALSEDGRYRASINTYLSLSGSIVGSFITSGIYNQGRIVFGHILFGCISGGIIISGCCSVCIDSWASLLIGTLSGIISIVLLQVLKQYFVNWHYYDIYNIIIIHGIHGLLGAFITPMMIGDIKRRLNNKVDYHYILLNDFERKNNIQAGVQVGAIFVTLGISFVSGIATGYLMKVSTCGNVNHYFTDSEFFENETNIIDNLEQNQFYYGEINRASLFQMQNQNEFPPFQRASDDRGSQPSYNN